jgi:uncharacterized protein DUF4386
MCRRRNFYGLWLFPLGVLTYRSPFLPRFLGVWLVLNGFAYLVLSFTGLLLPRYEDRASNIAFPVLAGEVALYVCALFLAFASLLGLGLCPYRTQAVVVCWLFFSLAFCLDGGCNFGGRAHLSRM